MTKKPEDKKTLNYSERPPYRPAPAERQERQQPAKPVESKPSEKKPDKP